MLMVDCSPIQQKLHVQENFGSQIVTSSCGLKGQNLCCIYLLYILGYKYK